MSERTAEALPRDASLGYQINHLGRLLAAALHRRIAPLGVAPGQFAQMLALFEQDGLTQRELCELVRIEQPTMANTLQRMERDNLIRREPDPADGRRTRVVLTARARDLEDHLITAARDVNAIATRGLSDHAVSDFMSALTQIINNLEAADHRPQRDNSEQP
ncbi:MAG: MarR family winged helix-turn-helix transcriptional regulator [Actinomycetota bacterium]|nr:MarR family winged helix-turn-helix transcriptional regulator [Actinomycetota bacterium]